MSQDQKQVLEAPSAGTYPAQPQAAFSSPSVTDNQVNTIHEGPAPAHALPSNLAHSGELDHPHPAAGPNNPNNGQLPPPYVEGGSGAKGVPAGNNVQMVTPLNMLTDQPGLWIDCPHCKQRTQTKVFTEGETMQFVVGALLCLFCICLTCVPCCAGWFERTNIQCTRCNKMVAVIPSEGPIQVMVPIVPQPSQFTAQAPPQQPMVAKPQN